MKYIRTPLQEIQDSRCEKAGVKLFVKREDLNHPFASGNKWWKLKYNLAETIRLKHHTVLTFGGAYSNHIYATAAACHETGLKSIGIIRGEQTLPLNHTLAFAQEKGMLLHYVSRETYKHKTETDFIRNLRDQFGDFYLLPEGGTNELAVTGVIEFAKAILSEIKFDYLCLPVGTGGTMAGIIAGLDKTKKVIGFSALKGGSFLVGKVKRMLENCSTGKLKNWRIENDYHFGGYGKSDKALENFLVNQSQNHNLPLDRVYTAKMMFGIYDLIKKGSFERGSIVLALHTGGLQGESVSSK